MNNYLSQNSLFQRFSERDLSLLLEVSDEINLPARAELTHEGEKLLDFYLILNGRVDVLKKSSDGTNIRILTLEANDLVGELAFLEESERAATIVTLEPTKLLRFKGKIIKNDPRYLELYANLMQAMGKSVSKRLRFTNDITVKAMLAELNSLKSQVALGVVMVSIFLLTTLYIFSLGIIAVIRSYLPSLTPISSFLIMTYALVLFIAILRTGYPLENYGITTKNWLPNIKNAILYTSPFLVIILLVKWILIHTTSHFHGYSLIQPFSLIRPGIVHVGLTYSMLLGAYILFSPIQEFIVRGALQSSFQLFLRQKSWTAILLSNLMFSAGHVHIAFWFSVLTFIPGLFWGWLYARQNSLVGVSVSHILLGVWALFIVGFPA